MRISICKPIYRRYDEKSLHVTDKKGEDNRETEA